MFQPRTLLVSSDVALIRFLETAATSCKHSTLEVVPSLSEVASRVESGDVALTIIHLRANDGLTASKILQEQISHTGGSTAFLYVCDEYQATQALDAIKHGAIDYLPRPLDQVELSFLIDMQGLRLIRQGIPVRVTKPAIEQQSITTLGTDNAFIYIPGMKDGQLAEQLKRIAGLASTVMLGGETGVGKSRLARLIHELSPRREKPMLTVNCGALSASLIESELFGHSKGAFTGADTAHLGKFAEAADGTLFLDEIDTLPLALQAKLLRTVEERVFEAVGSNKTQPMRARLIVASNRPLEQEVEAGRFRQDLFFRLNVISLDVPPLRDRSSLVIAEICREFLTTFAGQPGLRVTSEAMEALVSYPWPGNIRELRNVIERAVALSVIPTIGLEDLPEKIRDVPAPKAQAVPHSFYTQSEAERPHVRLESREENEVRRIVEALAIHGNNRRQAAIELGISRMTLYNKLHKYHLDTADSLHEMATA